MFFIDSKVACVAQYALIVVTWCYSSLQQHVTRYHVTQSQVLGVAWPTLTEIMCRNIMSRNLKCLALRGITQSKVLDVVWHILREYVTHTLTELSVTEVISHNTSSSVVHSLLVLSSSLDVGGALFSSCLTSVFRDLVFVPLCFLSLFFDDGTLGFSFSSFPFTSSSSSGVDGSWTVKSCSPNESRNY